MPGRVNRDELSSIPRTVINSYNFFVRNELTMDQHRYRFESELAKFQVSDPEASIRWSWFTEKKSETTHQESS